MAADYFGKPFNLLGSVGSRVTYKNTSGMVWLSFTVTLFAPHEVSFEATTGNGVWMPIAFQNLTTMMDETVATATAQYTGSISTFTEIRFTTAVRGKTPASIIGQGFDTPQTVVVTNELAVSAMPPVEVSAIPPVTGSVNVLNFPAFPTSFDVDNFPAFPSSFNIGTMPAITGSVTVSSLPAITGSVTVSSLPPVSVSNLPDITTAKYAVISASAANNTLVAAVAGKKIRVMQLFLTASLDTTVRFESNAGGSALTGTMSLYANAFVLGVLSASSAFLVLPYSPLGHFETSAGHLLNLTRSAGVVSGSLVYMEI